MKTYLALVLLLTLASISADAQLTRFGTIPRYGDSTGFVVFGGGGDGWPWHPHQGWAPAGSEFTGQYRFNDFRQCDTLGLNGFIGGNMWMTLRDRWHYVDTFSWWDATPDMLVQDPREPYTPYCMANITAISPVTFNALSIRFECERHQRAPSASWGDTGITHEYPGFVNDSTVTLTGVNAFDSQGTFPLWLQGTSRDTETANTIVRMRKGTDTPGLFENRLSVPNFLYSLFWHGGDTTQPWNRKLIAKARVRLDSLTPADSIVRLFALSSPPKAFEIRIFEGSDTLVDTAFRITSANFSHAGLSFDTVSVTFLADTISDSIKIQMQWFGKVSMSADYLDIMTTVCDTGATDSASYAKGLLRFDIDQWQAAQLPDFVRHGAGKFCSYDYLVNHGGLDTVIKRLFVPYDSVLNFTWTDEDMPNMGSVEIQKRYIKRLSELTHIAPLHWTGDSAECSSRLINLATLFVEGVSKRWFDSSTCADPRFFGLEIYKWNDRTALPRRIKSINVDTLRDWVFQHASDALVACQYDTQFVYGRYSYMRAVQAGDSNCFISPLGELLRQCRWAKRVTERTRKPGFHQRFFVALQSGSGRKIVNSAGHQKLVFDIRRSMTGAEWTASAHLVVASGASGILPYGGIITGNVPNSDGGFCSPWGYHDSAIAPIKLDSNIGTADSIEYTWEGWNERFDAAAAVFPVLIQYGNALLKSNWLGDYRVPELDSKAKIPFKWNSVRALDDTDKSDTLSFVNADSNRTYVFISSWQDTTTGDTLLYIVNMRTDDSWKPNDTVCSTQDRRYITMQMKAPHLVRDVADPSPSQVSGKVRTPFVAAGDSLRVWLLPGDGVLVRLTPAPDSLVRSSVLPEALSVSENPFEMYTSLRFHLHDATDVRVEVFDILGNLVLGGETADGVTLHAMMSPGEHWIPIDLGQRAAGTYFLRVSLGAGEVQTLKLIKE